MNAPSIDIKDMLVAADLGLTFGTNLFVAREPSMPVRCTTIYDTPGMGPGLTMDPAERYEYPSIQVRIRHDDYRKGWKLAEDIITTLHGCYNQTVNNTVYTHIRCSGGPFLLERDANERFIIVINFNLQRR